MAFKDLHVISEWFGELAFENARAEAELTLWQRAERKRAKDAEWRASPEGRAAARAYNATDARRVSRERWAEANPDTLRECYRKRDAARAARFHSDPVFAEQVRARRRAEYQARVEASPEWRADRNAKRKARRAARRAAGLPVT